MWKFFKLIVFYCTILQVLASKSINNKLADVKKSKSGNGVIKINESFPSGSNGPNPSKHFALGSENEFEEIDVNDDEDTYYDEPKELSFKYISRNVYKRSVGNVPEESAESSNSETQSAVEEGAGESNSIDPQDDIAKANLLIYKARKEINKLVSTYVFGINVTILEAEESLDKEFKELDVFVTQTQDEASEDNIDIQTCFNYTKNINVTNIFSDCEINEQLYFIESQITALDEVEKTFNDGIISCNAENKETELDQCIEEIVTNTDLEVLKIKKSVETLLIMYNINRFNCIESVFRKTDDAMNKAVNNFNACVEVIMSAESDR